MGESESKQKTNEMIFNVMAPGAPPSVASGASCSPLPQILLFWIFFPPFFPAFYPVFVVLSALGPSSACLVFPPGFSLFF